MALSILVAASFCLFLQHPVVEDGAKLNSFIEKYVELVTD